MCVSLSTTAQTEVTDTLLYKFSFRQDKSALDLLYSDNGKQMNRLSDTLGKIAKRTDCEIVAVNVEGNASPEGSAAQNVALALRRAKEIRNHLLGNTSIDPDLIKAYSLGVDREKLVKLLSKSDYPYRDTLINLIVKSRHLPAERVFATLKKLDGGQHCKWMLQNVFP